MSAAFSQTTIHHLKGAPASILLALQQHGAPLGPVALAHLTGWSRNRVYAGLEILQATGLARQVSRLDGWELLPAAHSHPRARAGARAGVPPGAPPVMAWRVSLCGPFGLVELPDQPALESSAPVPSRSRSDTALPPVVLPPIPRRRRMRLPQTRPSQVTAQTQGAAAVNAPLKERRVALTLRPRELSSPTQVREALSFPSLQLDAQDVQSVATDVLFQDPHVLFRSTDDQKPQLKQEKLPLKERRVNLTLNTESTDSLTATGLPAPGAIPQLRRPEEQSSGNREKVNKGQNPEFRHISADISAGSPPGSPAPGARPPAIPADLLARFPHVAQALAAAGSLPGAPPAVPSRRVDVPASSAGAASRSPAVPQPADRDRPPDQLPPAGRSTPPGDRPTPAGAGPRRECAMQETDCAIQSSDCVIQETDCAIQKTDCAMQQPDCAIPQPDCAVPPAGEAAGSAAPPLPAVDWLVQASQRLFGEPVWVQPGDPPDSRLLLAWMAQVYGKRACFRSPARVVYTNLRRGYAPDACYLADPWAYLPEWLSHPGVNTGAAPVDLPGEGWDQPPEADSGPPPDPSLALPVRLPDGPSAGRAWERLLAGLLEDMPPAFRRLAKTAWLAHFDPDATLFTVAAPDQPTRDWLADRLTSLCRRQLMGVCGRPAEVRFVVGTLAG